MDRFLHLSALFIILTLYSPAYGAKSYPPRFPIYENGRAGFIDKSGTVVIKPRFDWTDEYFRGPYCRASLKKKMGIIDRSGKWVIQPRFFSIGYPSGGYVTVSDKKYKSAFVSMKGVRLTPYIYDRIEPFLRGECLVVKGDKYGILNSSLKPLIPIVYDHLTPFRDGLAVAK
ncbi:WG repeat-containing protein, partial [Myxococcota bacterium]|nr:WG repeat-containing protein [Myxococcota bacterium]